MEKTVLAVLLLTVAVVTAADGSHLPSAAADGSYQPSAAAADITRISSLIGGYSNGLKDKLVCLEKKLQVVKQCETMLTNVQAECNEGNSFLFLMIIDELLCFLVTYRDCKDAYSKGQTSSRIYTINPDYGEPFNVFCDMSHGGGWVVIQRRGMKGGSEDFYKGWEEYVKGFGDLNNNYWLGQEKIYRLTKANSMLRVDLRSFTKGSKYAQYSQFRVDSSVTSYKLAISGYSGTAGDSLKYHNGMKFTTKDRDNDAHSGGNCATINLGAWWYKSCQRSSLNGFYVTKRLSGTGYCMHLV